MHFKNRLYKHILGNDDIKLSTMISSAMVGFLITLSHLNVSKL